MTGEPVTYQYDSLQRLVTAATVGPQWGLAFTYDGFGNRLSQQVTKGTAPAVYSSYDAATSRITGYIHDGNGNITWLPNGTTLPYDVENGVTTATVGGSVETYYYAPDGKRVYRKAADGTQYIYFYGVMGERIGPYFMGSYVGQLMINGTPPSCFAGRRLGVAVDRFGSVRMTFISPDPYVGSAGLKDPGSWNRYAYAANDPVNFNDSSGLNKVLVPIGGDCSFNGEYISCTGVHGIADTGGYAGSDGGSGGGGGGWIPDGLLDLLSKPDCGKAVGASSPKDATAKLTGHVPQMNSLGELQYTQTIDANGNEVTTPTATSPPLAEATTGFLGKFQSIVINTYTNYFNDPTNAQVLINGKQVTMNLVTAEAAEVGVSSLSVSQYQDLLVPHELKHLFKGSHDDTPAGIKAYSHDIVQDCLGLKVNWIMWVRIILALGFGLASQAAGQSLSEYCAVEVHIRNSTGAQIDTPVMLEAGKEKLVAQSANGVARFCDVGFDEFSIVVGEPCGRVTVSGLTASPPSTRVVNVIYDPCWSERPPGGNACTILLRVGRQDGAPLAGAFLWINRKLYRESDQYGRMFVMVRYGDSLRGSVRRGGYRDLSVDIPCRTDESRFERRIALIPASP